MQKQKIRIRGVDYDITGKNVLHLRSNIKLWVQFKREHYKPRFDNPNTEQTGRSFYMKELVASVRQVMFQNVHPFVNHQQAFDRAEHMINETFHDKYKIARIYFEWQQKDKENNNEWIEKNYLLCEYENGSETFSKELPWKDDLGNYIQWKENKEGLLKKSISKADIIIDYPNRQEIIQRNINSLPWL